MLMGMPSFNDAPGGGVDAVRRYWDKRASEETDACGKIESGPRGQRMRFENFRLGVVLEGSSVLDVGCGVGDFYGHLKACSIGCDYTGVDISAPMVEQARRRYPAGRFEVANILETADEKVADYTVAFAIHNVVVPGGWQLLEAITRRQFALCRVAAHVDLLTDRFQGFDPHIQSWRAEDILALALEITPYATLRHHYLPNAFSVTLYREPLIDTATGLHLDWEAPAA